MDKQDYENKVQSMLSDEKTYLKLDSDPTPKYKRKLVSTLKHLKKENKITEGQYKDLYPTAENVPRLLPHQKSTNNMFLYALLWTTQAQLGTTHLEL